MIPKLILEDGITLSKYKKTKILEDYKDKGLVSLPDGVVVKSIQGLPAEHEEYTVIIIIGRQQNVS
jgi:hypothetical protein